MRDAKQASFEDEKDWKSYEDFGRPYWVQGIRCRDGLTPKNSGAV